ncbi:sulfotransferase domain-containing protein [Algoriphagus sp. PAP.12]|uniref:sulfotransferase domain-containing protein n=1 Tax=Algoriphagus sp. PAP.12 TaxID=2996678 RepID=UPI00227C863D|nr:sulfotransferase domain-containing protein [Algoriphagus sp. PAP.12]
MINYFRDIISLDNSDVFLMSYPKSGNTRYRMAIAQYLKLYIEDFSERFSYDYVNSVLPEFGKGNIAEIRQFYYSKELYFGGFPLFIKSHLSYPIVSLLVRKNPILYIERNSPDTVMSYYDYCLARKIIGENYSFSKFLRSPKFGIGKLVLYSKHMNLACSHKILYDDLLYRDIDVILNSLKFLGVDFNVGLMTEAIKLTRRDKAVNFKNKLDSSSYNFAASKSRILTDYFSDSDVVYYNKIISSNPLFSKIPL